MDRLMIRLWGIIEGEGMHSINYQIAQSLITNMRQITGITQKELAKLCNVSKPSFSRFCKDLGYVDFMEFQTDLVNFLPDPGEKFIKTTPGGGKNWICEYIDDVANNLENFRGDALQNQIETLVKDIATFEHVYMLGNLHSGRTASNVKTDLYKYKKSIEAITDYRGQVETLAIPTKNSLYIVFSVSGDYFKVLFSENSMHEHCKESKVWLVTTNPDIAEISGVDEILNTATGSNLSGANISLDLVGNLISLGYWKYINK